MNGAMVRDDEKMNYRENVEKNIRVNDMYIDAI